MKFGTQGLLMGQKLPSLSFSSFQSPVSPTNKIYLAFGEQLKQMDLSKSQARPGT